MSNHKPRVVVVGNGMVGHHFVEYVCEQGWQGRWDLLVIGAERQIAYDRVQLSSYFQGRALDELALGTEAQYRAWGVELKLGCKVVSLHPEDKQLTLDSGETLAYDHLVLATGSYGFVPPIPGADKEACLVYRTTEDLLAIEAAARDSRSGVVIGGGLLGLEAANALKSLGLKTHVVEFAPQLMPVQLDAEGGELLRSKIEALGVSVHTARATSAILDGETARLRLSFTDGEILETDMLVFSAGIRPFDELGKVAGLALGARGGFAVDGLMRTSAPGVFAIGECASWQDRIYGLVAPGYQMARIAADTLMHDAFGAALPEAFVGADMSTKLKLLGIDVGAIGNSRGNDELPFVEFSDAVTGVYKKLWLDESGTRLAGALLVGDASDYGRLLGRYLGGSVIDGSPAALLLGEPASTSADALVCSCHQVSHSAIVKAVKDGCETLGDIKRCTKAASGCGGCGPEVQKIIDTALAEAGKARDSSLCPHFGYSRQELFHLCALEEIKDFDTLLTRHGRPGAHPYGCAVCQPVAASIFATLHNDHVLGDDRARLQDTNDAFLGNLQKDGTYSVVPRIAGGEITPEKLIVLGEVARDFDLYTKITGGQRIDLFGARLEDLPAIWTVLVEAGFETGHAYGKSLRTVKSCVGSTWCRYGVQDSVSMAITLEHRYKGLRSPHKLKLAVSGCARECAEAQSKDIGVIATDKGWNLYVGGNGGMRPRHADLFASDLSDEALIDCIDRILMFYASTADRLQRTSVWLESLEGGVDYLRQVVLEDSLGLGAELSRRMQQLVNGYRCEWKAAIEDPAIRRRFVEFVNPAPTAAPELPYRRVRGQKMPLTPAQAKDLRIDIKELS
ncbi:nitrite reductase large subunit NirB [Shewanella sedimentimangrovi]|uniref:Nitrite reductase large subunit n=1 Tax=Shewanella sedimentimangrovi TaxID=2814293 RepID=A0ABX7QXS8_9GAMM|nr:nitrite reductase large subunit NirB [Shewanella sedimentimangrovi]QSX35842.1 nitrite reductase large subunit [Shewanella sedimentimangrovi]